MKKLTHLLLTIAFFAFSSCNDSDGVTITQEKLVNLKGEAIEIGAKLTWDRVVPEVTLDRIDYQIYSKVGNSFELIGTTEYPNFTHFEPIIGVNIYKVRAIVASIDHGELIGKFSDEISVQIDSYNYIGTYKSDIQTLYEIKQANPNSNLTWEFDFMNIRINSSSIFLIFISTSTPIAL